MNMAQTKKDMAINQRAARIWRTLGEERLAKLHETRAANLQARLQIARHAMVSA